MGLFRKKEIYEYKMLERVKINIEEVNRLYQEGKSENVFGNQEYCELVTETKNYQFYRYLAYKDGSGGYLLRRNKHDPSQVVFFGKSSIYNVAFHDHIFQVDHTGELYDFCISLTDAETGQKMNTDWLSPNGHSFTIDGYGRTYCQDSILDAFIEGECLVFRVHRDKANELVINPRREIDKLNDEFDYDLVVRYQNNRFVVDYRLPDTEMKKDQIDKQKSDKIPCWRDKQTNRIVCPGDDCPEECTEDCPIWCNTLAAKYFGMNDYSKAKDVLTKSVSLAPDFKDAWNNLGSCCGLLGLHQEALDAYKKAYELDHDYKKAIYGIAVSAKNLGYYQECLNWCDLYMQQFNDPAIDRVIEDCKNRMMDEAERDAALQKRQDDRSFGAGRSTSVIDNDNTVLAEEYGKLIPLLLDEDTRVEGYKEIEKIFEKGFSEAGIILGQWYSGTDREKSKKYFSVPASEDDAEALWGLANCLSHNYIPIKGNPRDDEWVNAIEKAARLGCPDAMNEAGNIEYRLKNYYLAAYWYGMADLYDHPQAIYGRKGIAREWIKAGRPDIPNEYRFDPMYQQGKMMMRVYADADQDFAIKNIEKEATNDSYAALALYTARTYESKDDNETAIKYYRIAADRGDLFAIRTLAGMLFIGLGCEEDTITATELYRKAAEKGDSISCSIIGAIESRSGNRELANMWFAKALVRGYNEAASKIQ